MMYILLGYLLCGIIKTKQAWEAEYQREDGGLVKAGVWLPFYFLFLHMVSLKMSGSMLELHF